MDEKAAFDMKQYFSSTTLAFITPLMQNNDDDDDVVKMKVLTGKKWTNFGVSRSTFPLIQDSYFYCNEVRQ